MLNLINVEKPIKVNGEVYPNSKTAFEAFKNFKGELEIILNFKPVETCGIQTEVENQPAEPQSENKVEYRIKVRQYMTKKASPAFDFMEKWNNNTPMPMRVMYGTIEKETRGMYLMKLHAKPAPSSHCMVCARKLTHPVSLHYGIGPECGGHFHINPYETEEQLNAEYDQLKQRLADITWEGWIIKSAIEEQEVSE